MAPKESNWLRFFSSGYCISEASIVDPVHGKGKTKFQAVWTMIYLHDIGYILFDTGYSKAFFTATESFPERFYRWATPVFISDEETAVVQLEAIGVRREAIKYIIISHFHADHIGGLIDFPEATFICAESALHEIKEKSGIKAVRKGLLKGLLPKNFYSRVQTIEEMALQTITTAYGLTFYTIFRDDSFQLVRLDGHAKGMLGFYWKQDQTEILYATDASWSAQSFENDTLPRQIVRLFFDSWSEYVKSQNKLRKFKLEHPSTRILFTHCPITLSYLNHDF